MKQFNELLIIGPKHVHVENFISIVRPCFDKIVLITEEDAEYPQVDKHYTINFRSFNPLALFKKRKELKKIIQTENPDFIHLHSANRVGFMLSLVMKHTNIPLITTTWGSDVLLVPKRNLISKLMVKRILNKSAVITADSLEMIESINELTNHKTVEFVLFGIDSIPPQKKEKVVYSNRLHNPLYNIDEIIKLFYGFQRTNPDWNLIIGAVGSETESLKELVKGFDLEEKVEFVGWLNKEDNRNFYAKASIYISIPSSDGTAVSLLEAMSAGCVPVVSDLVVSKEWIENGENGIIYNGKENPISEALKLSAEEVSEINKKIIEEKGTKEIATEKFYEIYQQLKTTK